LNHGNEVNVEYDRKEAKLHGDASLQEKLMVTGAIRAYSKIIIVDDVATSMATKYDALNRIREEARSRDLRGVHVSGFLVGVDRQQTTAVYKNYNDLSTIVLDKKGDDAIMDFCRKTHKPVYAIVGIKEIVNYLYNERLPVLQNNKSEPISNQTMDIFKKYMKTYGV
jgi:orotate phosphoribosyltransferase